MKYNKRQQSIIDFARNKESFQTKDVFAVVGKEFDVERITIVRDLKKLFQGSVLNRTGTGKLVRYHLTKKFRITEVIPVQSYFATRFQERDILPFFNADIFEILADGVFTPEEIKVLDEENKQYNKHKDTLRKESPAILRREWERLIIELSWKSSEIEGNTYTLLETETLIKDHQLAKGKDEAEARMILNHKDALDFILENPKYFETYNEEKIRKMHVILTEGMDIKKDFRNHPVGIGGSFYRPLAKQAEISPVMKSLTELIENQKSVYNKAFIALMMLAYIQPFEDGNKRTARIVANAILYAHDCAMLSYRDVSVDDFKKSVILFYEQNNIAYAKEIFMKQFSFAVRNYFNEL